MMKTYAVAYHSGGNTIRHPSVKQARSISFFSVILNVLTTRRMDTGGSMGPTASVGIKRVFNLSPFGLSKQRRFHIIVCTTTLKRYPCFVFTKRPHLFPMSSLLGGVYKAPGPNWAPPGGSTSWIALDACDLFSSRRHALIVEGGMKQHFFFFHFSRRSSVGQQMEYIFSFNVYVQSDDARDGVRLSLAVYFVPQNEHVAIVRRRSVVLTSTVDVHYMLTE